MFRFAGKRASKAALFRATISMVQRRQAIFPMHLHRRSACPGGVRLH
jgi:hypothetical protein